MSRDWTLSIKREKSNIIIKPINIIVRIGINPKKGLIEDSLQRRDAAHIERNTELNTVINNIQGDILDFLSYSKGVIRWSVGENNTIFSIFLCRRVDLFKWFVHNISVFPIYRFSAISCLFEIVLGFTVLDSLILKQDFVTVFWFCNFVLFMCLKLICFMCP